MIAAGPGVRAQYDLKKSEWFVEQRLDLFEQIDVVDSRCFISLVEASGILLDDVMKLKKRNLFV